MATTPPDTLTNTLTNSTFNIAGITFNAGAPVYTMTGNTFNLTAGITNNSGLIQVFNNTGGLFTTVGTTYATGTGGISLSGLTFVGGGQTTTVTGAGGLSIAALTLNNGARVNQTFNGAGNVTIGSIAPGTGGNNTLTYAGTGILTVTGTSSINSSNTADAVSSGTFVLASTGNIGQGITSSGTGTFTENAGGVLSGSGPVTQGSSATMTLAGLNTYTGGTTVNAGTLLLDFSAATTPATATNIINNTANTSALTLGGGTLSIKGGGTGDTNSQRFSGLTLTAATSSRIIFTQNGDTSLSATLGAITARGAGSTLDITLPTAGTVSTTSTTFATNGVLTSAATNGVAFATVNGGTAFASNTTGTIGAITPAAGTYGATANVSVSAGDAPASGAGANTLTFNGAADSVAFTGTNAITTGGILVTPSATGASTISGGTLTAGGGKELTIFNNEPVATGNSLTISSVIADNATASALTIAGVGTTILSSANTFTGQTTLLGGTLNSRTAWRCKTARCKTIPARHWCSINR